MTRKHSIEREVSRLCLLGLTALLGVIAVVSGLVKVFGV